MRTVNVGIVGLGTIGTGVLSSLKRNSGLIVQRTGVDLKIKGVCDTDPSVLGSQSADLSDVKVTSDFKELIADKDIEIIVELIGGIEPARTVVLEALNAGKHVVTANKALISEHWKALAQAARDNDVLLRFEASVAGAIPVIRALTESFVANRIEAVYGILNGTTNYILTQMDDRGMRFAKALEKAQEKGFAESDPTLDINGMDSAHKLAILAFLAFGIDVTPADIYVEGIERIDPFDMELARGWGYSIKLLSIAKNTDRGVQLRVHPSLVKTSHLLSSVQGEDNAVFVEGDLFGSSLFYGKGAGAYPTASSVIGDIVEVARGSLEGARDLLSFSLGQASSAPGKIVRMEDTVLCYYLRFSVIDKPGVLADIASYLAANDIGIASVTQQGRRKGASVPVVILTHESEERALREAIAKIDERDYVTDRTVIIRREKE